MPEGPEVAIITNGLADLLENKMINKVCIDNKSRYSKKKPVGFDEFEKALPLKVKSIKCKGKFIYWEFSNGTYMYNTLGLSGVWTKNKMSNIVIIMNYSIDKINNISKTNMEHNSCSKGKLLYFNDVRHFGTLKFVNSKKELEKKLKTIGPDMLHDKDMSYNKFKMMMNKCKNKNITVVLMHQRIMSGVGNYLKSEALYASKISPHRSCDTLKDTELRRLYKEIRSKIKESFKMGGMSRKDYKDINNKSGNFSSKLEVYGKTVDKYSNIVEKFTSNDGRTTYWVKKVQK